MASKLQDARYSDPLNGKIGNIFCISVWCYDLSTGEVEAGKILRDAYLKLDTDSDDIPWKLW